MKLVLSPLLFFFFFFFTFSSSSSTSQQHLSQSPSDNATHLHQHAGGAGVSDHRKTVGVFLNYTRDLVNFTNKHFPEKTTNSNDQPLHFRSNEHQILLLRDDDNDGDDDDHEDDIDVTHDDDDEQETEVRDLLSGILADEFDGVETDKDVDDHDEDHHQDIFHDDHDDSDDDGDDDKVVERDHDFKVRTDHVLHHHVDNGTVMTSKYRTGRARQDKVTGAGAGRRPGSTATGGRTKGKGKKNGKKQVDVAKYNGYVDAVFKRMNSLIRAKRMDPLRVNLFAGKQANTGGNGGGGGGNGNGGQKKGGGLNKNNNKKSGGHSGGKRGPAAHRNNNNKKNKGGKGGKKRNQHNHQNQRRGPKIDDEVMEEIDVHVRRERKVRSDNVTTAVMTDKMRPISVDAQTNRSSSSAPTVETSSASPVTSSSSSSSESSEVKDTESQRENPNRPTRGVLHGLSTLRRTGPVKVLRRGADVRLVRAKFLLGPVALDILPKKSSNGTKTANMPTATATARSLNGVLEIRLKNAGPTRIRKLRVFPPANVRVEGEGEKNNGMKKQGYRKVTPVAARRLMSVANQVVRQTGRLRNKAKNNKRGGNSTKRKGSAHNNNNNNNVHINRRYHQ